VTDRADLLRRPLDDVLAEARAVRERAHGALVTYSPKVFVPLTKLCRDVCHYCTFARPPRRGERAYMTADEVLAIARAGAAAGCHEALFTLGDKPELRYRVARDELRELGCETTLVRTTHPVVDIVRFQLLTLDLAERRGVDPDLIRRDDERWAKARAAYE
jgi:2-iminoacetate synthase ThiH